jgi:deoxyadenosine/deoxycytidine kinase
LQNLQDTYSHYLKNQSVPTLLVDVSQADFIDNPAHFQQMLEALEKDYEPGQHFLTLS